MLANFDPCTRLILRTEGGYSNNPCDPGGPTYCGITLATARTCVDPTMTAGRLRTMTVEQIEMVYRTMYADRVRFDAMPSGIDYALYDYSVNSGPARANRVVRHLVGAAPATTMALDVVAMIKRRDEPALIRAICAERLAFMRSLRTWSAFGKGWSARVAAVEAHAIALAAGFAPSAAAPLSVPTSGKATTRRVTSSHVAGISASTVSVTTLGGSAAMAGHHIGPYGAMVLAVGAVGVIGAVVAASDRASQVAALSPASGTAVVPPKPSSTGAKP